MELSLFLLFHEKIYKSFILGAINRRIGKSMYSFRTF